MYYIGLDVHKKTISYCIKDASGQVHREGTIGATRNELDRWMKTLPQPWTVAMEATIFTGWIYDHFAEEGLRSGEFSATRSFAGGENQTPQNDSRSRSDYSTDMGTGDWGRVALPIDPAGHQLLRALR